MTTKAILKGLKYRLKSLEEAYECLSKPENNISKECLADYEGRMDEVESLIYWIEGKSGN